MSFVPLHVYTGYSFLKSGLKIDQYLSESKKLGYNTVGISDFATFTSAPIIFHEAEKQGLKVILGEDLLIDHLLFSFYVLNETGYQNLLKLSLLASVEKANGDTIKEYQQGLAIVLSTNQEVFKSALLTNEDEFARKIVKVTRGFDNFFFGIDADDDNEEYLKAIREFSFSHGYETIAFPSIKYIKKEDAIVFEMMNAIDTKEVLDHKKLEGNEYLKNADEINAKYTEEEIKTIDEIVKNINFEFNQPRGKMISWNTPNGETSDDYLAFLARKGLTDKGKTDEKYIKRLNYELDVIKQMGYSDYFLIVQDYINYAKNNDIAVGPGRGSASGSLVSYALGITVPDPIENKLLFERFLNPARQTMPDIDVDFSDVRREDVVRYLQEKYGEHRVARIMAVQKMGAKAALNDVQRIFNYEKRDIELFTKLIKDDGDDKLTLREIYKTNQKFRDLVNNDNYYLEIVSLASKIEGMPRQASLHAVGIVLNADPLEGIIPLSLAFDGGYVEQFEKDYIEEQGFLKMDILALRNLTIVEDCLILLNNKGIKLDRDEIPYDTPEGMKIISQGKTSGLFQIDTPTMRKGIANLRPKTFNDLTALLALNRPGPMAFIKNYADRRDGKEKFTYLSSALEEILGPTYGIIVYQEQIMQIASKMAGFSLGEADSFRRAVSKKDSKKLESLRSAFVNGSVKNGYKKEEANNVFNLIDKFANYGFNKSHSLVYAIFTGRMAYLKAHYPAEFYTSILSNASATEFHNTVAEMKNLNIKLICPNINESTNSFALSGNQIMFPLGSVRGISGATVANILEERNKGKFTDIYDFIIRMSNYRFSDAQIMSLIDAGAFDSFNYSRQTLRDNLAAILTYTNAMVSDQGLAKIDESFMPKPQIIPSDDDYLNNLNREFTALGLMVSGSPLDLYKDKALALNAIKLNEIDNSHGDVKSIAIIKSARKTLTKDKKEMAFLTVYDDSSEKELVVFSEAFAKSKTALINGNVVIVEGYYRSNKGEFSVTKITSMEEAKNE